MKRLFTKQLLFLLGLPCLLASSLIVASEELTISTLDLRIKEAEKQIQETEKLETSTVDLKNKKLELVKKLKDVKTQLEEELKKKKKLEEDELKKNKELEDKKKLEDDEKLKKQKEEELKKKLEEEKLKKDKEDEELKKKLEDEKLKKDKEEELNKKKELEEQKKKEDEKLKKQKEEEEAIKNFFNSLQKLWREEKQKTAAVGELEKNFGTFFTFGSPTIKLENANGKKLEGFKEYCLDLFGKRIKELAEGQIKQALDKLKKAEESLPENTEIPSSKLASLNFDQYFKYDDTTIVATLEDLTKKVNQIVEATKGVDAESLKSQSLSFPKFFTSVTSNVNGTETTSLIINEKFGSEIDSFKENIKNLEEERLNKKKLEDKKKELDKRKENIEIRKKELQKEKLEEKKKDITIESDSEENEEESTPGTDNKLEKTDEDTDNNEKEEENDNNADDSKKTEEELSSLPKNENLREWLAVEQMINKPAVKYGPFMGEENLSAINRIVETYTESSITEEEIKQYLPKSFDNEYLIETFIENCVSDEYSSAAQCWAEESLLKLKKDIQDLFATSEEADDETKQFAEKISKQIDSKIESLSYSKTLGWMGSHKCHLAAYVTTALSIGSIAYLAYIKRSMWTPGLLTFVDKHKPTVVSFVNNQVKPDFYKFTDWTAVKLGMMKNLTVAQYNKFVTR